MRLQLIARPQPTPLDVFEPEDGFIAFFNCRPKLRDELRTRPCAAGGSVVGRCRRRAGKQLLAGVSSTRQRSHDLADRPNSNREFQAPLLKLLFGHADRGACDMPEGFRPDPFSAGAEHRRYCHPKPRQPFQILHSPNPQIPKSPNPQISKSAKSPSREIAKSPNHQTNQSPSLEIQRSGTIGD